MPETQSGDEATGYTFEQYNDSHETREWFENFLREHNGSNWREKLKFSVDYLLEGNFPKAPNGEMTRISWYRINYQGDLIGYADAKIHPIFNGRQVISDVWIVPRFRHQGHFHALFSGLVAYTKAVGIYIMMPKYRLYGGWFESFGFEWLSAFDVDPSDDPENVPVFVTTRDAYKDMIRFLMKYADGAPCPSSARARSVFEEVRRELGGEGT